MKLKITVHGVAYEVDVEVLDPGEGFAPMPALPSVSSAASPPPMSADRPHPVGPPPRPRSSGGDSASSGESASAVTSPIAGTVIEIKCKASDEVKEGDALMVIEAMKMNTSISAPRAGTIKSVAVDAGDTVREGATLVEYA